MKLERRSSFAPTPPASTLFSSMRPSLPFFILSLSILAAPAALGAAPVPPVRPNVVVLLTDDQGTLDANCYGSTDLKTPNIDRLSAGGVRFTQAYGHTVCCPSRAALFTGRHPQRGGVRNWTQGDRHGSDRQNLFMAPEEVTLAEALKSWPTCAPRCHLR